MREAYGSAWVSIYGAEPSDTWMRKLQTLSLDQIRAGLNAVTNRPGEFPPNLGQFVDLCGGSRKEPHLRYDPNDRACLSLAHKPEETESHAAQRIERNAHHARELLNKLKGVSA